MWKKSALVLTGSASLSALGYYFINNRKKVPPYVLDQVQVVVRHGARTPLSTLGDNLGGIQDACWKPELFDGTLKHTDIPYKIHFLNGQEWTEESSTDMHYKKKGPLKGGMLQGQLTTIGQQQSFDLGKWLNEEYIKKHKLISTNYSEDEIKIRSTNVKRTLYTAKCVASGLFGKENIKKPLQIITNYNEQEYLYPNWGFCRVYKEWVELFFADKSIVPGHTEDRKTIKEMLSLSDDYETDVDMVAVLDLLHCRKTHGFQLPESMLKLEKHIEQRAAEVHSFVIEGKEKIRGIGLSVGSLLNDICTVMEKNANGEPTHKMTLYSCHDTTIVPLLMALENWDYKWPSYASNISLELYKDEAEKRYVRILFNGKELKVDKSSTDNIIPLDRFLSIIEKYRVKDWASNCGNTTKEDEKNRND